MAKIGLNFGEKVQIADKSYRTYQDGLDVHSLLGELSWRKMDEASMVTEDDRTKPRNPDGSYPQVVTGEARWQDVLVFSPVQGKTISISIVDMPGYAIENLDLKLGDPIELVDVVVTFSNVSNGTWKIFASSLKKKGQPQPKQQPQHQPENKQN